MRFTDGIVCYEGHILSVVDLLGFFFLRIFCRDISKNLKFFSRGEIAPAHHGGQAVRSQEFGRGDPESFREQAASEGHRKWEEKILLMLDGRTKPCRVCWQHETF